MFNISMITQVLPLRWCSTNSWPPTRYHFLCVAHSLHVTVRHNLPQPNTWVSCVQCFTLLQLRWNSWDTPAYDRGYWWSVV